MVQVSATLANIFNQTNNANSKTWTATAKCFVIATGASLGTNFSSSEMNNLVNSISCVGLPLAATLLNGRANNGFHAYACKIFCGVVERGTTVMITANNYGYGANTVSIEAYQL